MGDLVKHVWARAVRVSFEDVRGRWMKQRKTDRKTGESHGSIKKLHIKGDCRDLAVTYKELITGTKNV